MITLLAPLIRFVNWLIPKDPHQILFVDHPGFDFADNPRALYDYLCKREDVRSQYKLIWNVAKKETVDKLRKIGITAYYQKSWRGVWSFLRSKYIITSHGDYLNYKVRTQILVNIGHGMALKSAGLIDKSEPEEVKRWITKRWHKECDALIATSLIMKHVLASVYWLNPNRVFVTGQPRNDKLFTEDGKGNLREILDIDIYKYKKIVLFSPTFRVWKDRNLVVGKPRDNILGFEDFNLERLVSFLEENNILLVLKFHPAEEKMYYHLRKMNNIAILTNKALYDRLLTIYDVLNAFDILITDYSSIYYDFLILDRPIIFVPIDIKDYRKSKGGFSVEPYDFWTPGPKVYTFKEFLRELERCITDPTYYHQEREIINILVNKYRDANSSKRLWELIIALGEKNHAITEKYLY